MNNNLVIIGNTPLIKTVTPGKIKFYAKLEAKNYTGSIKDRFAKNVIYELLKKKIIKPNGEIVESSSGNFGIALAAQSQIYGLKFTCVIDPNICPQNEKLLKLYGANIVKVKKHDKNGGYLLTRLAEVEKIQKQGAYWVNQYTSKYASKSYSNVVTEIIAVLPKIDYFFVAVGTGGTLAGISKRLRLLSPKTKIIAVDVDGSMVFSDNVKKRYVPGMGSSLKSQQINSKDYDDLIILTEKTGIVACQNMLKNQSLLLGGSSGVLVAAIDKYFINSKLNKKNINIVTIFPDGGDRYIENIYNINWLKKHFKGF